MKAEGLQWFKGVVEVEARGGSGEELVNKALAGGLSLSNIRWTSSGRLRFQLSVGDFFRLRPYLKETGCRVHVTGRKGFPFWLDKAGKRIWFTGGLVLFFAIVFMLSSLVWDIEVEGNARLTEEEILQAAKNEGLYPFQWSYKLQNAELISKNLAGALPGVTWIGVEKKGTRVTIQVVESTLPQPLPLHTPRHLVASADAVVTQIIADRGRPVVSKNMRVKEGQILISGTIGKDENSRTVVAEGLVKGLVWYEFNVESPLVQKVKVYTGETRTKRYLLLGNRALQYSGFGGEEYGQFETVTREERVSWRNWTLPVGRLTETSMESRLDERKLTLEEARAAGLLQARAELLGKAGADAVVRDEIVLHEKTDNGKVYMKVLFEVEQSITKEMPLVRIQGD